MVVVVCGWWLSLWVVVEFVVMGSDVVDAHCCSCWCRGGVSGGARVVAGGRLWAVVTHKYL